MCNKMQSNTDIKNLSSEPNLQRSFPKERPGVLIRFGNFAETKSIPNERPRALFRKVVQHVNYVSRVSESFPGAKLEKKDGGQLF